MVRVEYKLLQDLVISMLDIPTILAKLALAILGMSIPAVCGLGLVGLLEGLLEWEVV